MTICAVDCELTLNFMTAWTFIAGIIAIAGVIALGVASLIGVTLILMIKTQERVFLPYRPAVVTRLVLAVASSKF